MKIITLFYMMSYILYKYHQTQICLSKFYLKGLKKTVIHGKHNNRSSQSEHTLNILNITGHISTPPLK